MKKTWNKPQLINLNSDAIKSGPISYTYAEYVQFTVTNTATNMGADCTTYDGSTFTYNFSTGYPVTITGATLTTSIPCS